MRDNSMIALRYIRRAGRLTRYALAEQMDISLSLASKVSTQLIKNGLICELARSGVEVGRPSDLLALCPSAAYAVGLDVGGDYQVAVVTDLCGEVIASLEEASHFTTDSQEVLADLHDLVERVLNSAGNGAIPRERVVGVGLGVRDTVDPVLGVTYGWPDTPNWGAAWSNFPLREALARREKAPHILVDDIVRCQGLAEAHYGQGAQGIDFVYLLVDSGIGMAMMINGQPYIGHSHIAGEIGHISIGGSQIPCACGNVGCLEKLTSVSSILARAQQRLAETDIRSSLRQSNGSLTIEAFLLAAEDGDKLAYQLLTETGEELGKALAVVLNLFGPGLIVVGGVVSRSDIYLDAARRVVKLMALEKTSRDVVVRRTALGELAGARGAATMVLNALFEPGEKNILRLIDLTRASQEKAPGG